MLFADILFVAMGFAVMTCMALRVYCYCVRARKRKAVKIFNSAQTAGKNQIALPRTTGVSGEGEMRKKNKLKYSPFRPGVQNAALHQSMVNSISMHEMEASGHNEPGSMNSVQPIASNFSLDCSEFMNVGSMSQKLSIPNEQFGQSLRSESMVNDVLMNQVINDMAASNVTPIGDDDADVDDINNDDDDLIIGDITMR